jgi:hypothetical protein
LGATQQKGRVMDSHSEVAEMLGDMFKFILRVLIGIVIAVLVLAGTVIYLVVK